jgi:hypothetical protein
MGVLGTDFMKHKPLVADRLLILRENAGGDPGMHERYHRIINRYQRVLLRKYALRRRYSFLRWFFFR